MAQWRDVLDAMVQERRSALVAYAGLFVTNRADAEDLVHEAIVRTFARPRVVTDIHAAEGYVRRAIRTAFLDQTRARRTWLGRVHLFRGESTTPAADGPATAAVDVHDALARLSPRERACVVLRYFDDLLVAEIAQTLDLSEGAVKRYLSDATRRLRDVLDLDPDPDDLSAETTTVTEHGRSRA